MKILIISHMYPSNFNEVGGIFVHQQVKELQKQGYEIKVISPVPLTPFPIKYLSKKWKRYSEIPLQIKWENISVYYPCYLEFPRSLFFASSGTRMYWGIKKIIVEIYKNFKFNIIHAHVALPDGYAGMLLAQKYKKPLIVTIHGQDLQYTIYKNKKYKKIIKKVINFSKKTIVVSNKLKNIGEKELKINPQKLITTPNGINVKDIYTEKSDLLERYKGKKIVLSVSRIINIKGINYNLQAIANLQKKYPDLLYLIIGDGSERKKLEKLTKRLKLKNNVIFLGQQPHEKVMEYMSICNIFSLPSWEEGFGVVYLEAAASGKPVIACYGQGIDGVLEDKKSGLLVKPKDIDSLVKVIDFLLSNPESAKEAGKRARKLIFENYTWGKVVKKIIEVYNSIINKQ